MTRSALLVVALLLAGCASTEEPARSAPPPPVDDAAAPPPSPPRRSDQVLFSVTQADLATQVLPLFEQQVGVVIRWHGDPRTVTLRLTQPLHWEEALELVCQFTRTHPMRDYQGRIVLKDGWGGDLGDGDLEALQGRSSTTGRIRSGAATTSTPGWDDGSRPAPRTTEGIPRPTGAYSGGEEAGRILRGASTRTSPR